MATPEGKVKGWLDKMFKAEGVCYFAPQAGPYGSSGVEDRIAIVCGLYLGVEAKADASKKMTAKQELRKKAVLAAGGTHFLVYDKATIEAVRQWIENVRTRYSRQEGTGHRVGEPRSNTGYYIYGESSPDEFSYYSPSLGRMFSLTEPRVPHTQPDPVPLHVAGPVQANGPPAGHGSLPNHT